MSFKLLEVQVILFLIESQGDGHTVFIHPNPRFLSKDIDTLGIKKMKGLLDSVVQKKNDYKGNIGDQYIFIHPIDKELPFYMVALVPINDIKSPIKQLTSRMNQLEKDFRNSYFYFGILFTILVFLFALLFGIRIIRPITKLTNVAEKISLGDLKTLIDIDTDDDIGELASALRRMQASLFKAVSRLQKRE